MDDRIAAIINQIDPHDIVRVASGALGRHVQAVGPLTLSEITTPHAEARTVAIVKIAASADGHAWSCVVKALDMSVAVNPRVVGSTAPETEEIVYEEGYFADRPSGLRPARCYLVSRPTPQLKLLWLEDLTGAACPPFSHNQLREMSRQFGAWNGEYLGRPPMLKFGLLRNTFVPRYLTWDFPTKLRQMSGMWNTPAVRAMYRDAPLSVAADLVDTMLQLIERCAGLPGTLAYGDCSAGNLFFLDGRTVGIDWASLSLEATGVDAGCLVGSSITWGRNFAAVALHERELFDCYLDGLRSSLWRGDAEAIRRGYFCQFGFYLSATLMLPINLNGTDNFLSESFFEKRYGMPAAEIPERAASIVDLIPAFTAEIRALLR
jgi:hypothetical protein